MNKLLFFCVVLATLCSWKKIDKHTPAQNTIDSITAYGMSFSIMLPMNLNCEQIPSYSEVYNFNLTKYKKRIMKALKATMPPPKNAGIDARAVMYIWYHTGKTDTVCLCNTPGVSINRKLFIFNQDNDIYKIIDSFISIKVVEDYNKENDIRK